MENYDIFVEIQKNKHEFSERIGIQKAEVSEK